MPDEHSSENPDLRELARAVGELNLRLERLERRFGEAGGLPNAQHRIASERLLTDASPPASSPLESRIGSQWLNRVGVVAVLFGVAYLLRFAFVNEWISAAAWIWAGVCGGIAVVAGSEWFRRHGYRVLSLSLKATGIGIVYLALWAGLELYKLISEAEAFLGFVVVSAATTALALRESAEVLAGLAVIGGFLTPLLISIPSEELPLFTYLAVIDLAVAVVVLHRGWWRLSPLSFAATVLLACTWYVGHYRPAELSFMVVGASVFLAIFLATMLLARAPHQPGHRMLLVIAAGYPAIYFLALCVLLGEARRDSLAIPAIGLALLYFALAQKARLKTPDTVRSLYGGLGTAWIAVTLVVVMQPEWLSLGWFVEAAIAMALGFWRDISWLRWSALLLLCAAVVKAFAYDVWQLGLGSRTLSFIALGVLLLAISFAYQRYGFTNIVKVGRKR